MPEQARQGAAVRSFLAFDFGTRRVGVASGNTLLGLAQPLRTIAAKGIPGFESITDSWNDRAPLRWDFTDPSPVADTIAFLLSDMARGISGELVHVDGGFHAMGTAIRGPASDDDAS